MSCLKEISAPAVPANVAETSIEEEEFEVEGSTVDESEIRERVESKELFIEATANWYTPSGKRRTVPIYEAEIANWYLNKHRTVKAKSTDELEAKVRQVAEIWAEQETRKRIVDGKRDAKEHAQAEAQRLDQEAKEALADAEGLLAATLAIDDRIDWEAERDTRDFKRFSFSKPPQQPAPRELQLPPEPGLAWLLRGRFRRWEAECEEKARLHRETAAKVKQDWEEAVREHEQSREEARKQHKSDKEQFLGVKAIPSWNSPRLLMAYAAFFFDVVVSIFSSRFNASRSLGRCR